MEHDSDVDDDFKMGFMAASNKHGYKRKKKHMFTESGVEVEPFHLRNDIRDGLLTHEGYIKTNLRDFDRKQAREAFDASDAWLDSELVKKDQEKRLKEQQRR